MKLKHGFDLLALLGIGALISASVLFVMDNKWIAGIGFLLLLLQILLLLVLKKLFLKDCALLMASIKSPDTTRNEGYQFQDVASINDRMNHLKISIISQLEKERKTLGTLADKFYNAKTQSIKDPLTQVYNRRFLEDKVEFLIKGGQPFGVIFLDIDHFKKVNDNYGHDAGDLVLKTLAHRIGEGIRPGDILARYGGEEFVIVADKLNSKGQALNLAERVRFMAASKPIEIGELQLSITISLGATVFVNGDSMDKVFKRADQALYQAKETGRNKAVFG
ncbi:GGDEF domain-containing protein [Desulforamulus ruminis]|uniref:Diguanylate cyclase n=1 Tax=Desulforamulus ruminis (strain ATCC 23193 / DSM 2154 / NCIMB 8452 / DL) TaxID=696281 RepID=F6DQ42_DESRL|nr:GGDEF domain-containing protein [Desulforamulus ruminis]AEG61986.1 diguanylate cyclase [Desulforamulus ruminis DSM 2154]